MRIAQCLADTGWGDVGPKLLVDGCGGRELCALALSREWARAGHHVTNMVPREDVLRVEHPSGGTEIFAPVEGAVHVLRGGGWDAVLCVELPELLLDVDARRALSLTPQVVHFQVAHARSSAARACRDFIERHGELPFRWSALSPWHARFMMAQLPGESPLVNANGCFPAELRPQNGRQRGPVFHWGSSPDRGLQHLRWAWPEIRKRMPDAELHVLYGTQRFLDWALWTHYRDAESALSVKELQEMPGVHVHGLVGRAQLSRILRSSSALLYPCDPASPTETGCITAIESAGAGAVPVLTDADCLLEEFGDVADVLPLPVSTVALVDAAERAVDERPSREAQLLEFAAGRDWEVIARRWLDTFETLAS